MFLGNQSIIPPYHQFALPSLATLIDSLLDWWLPAPLVLASKEGVYNILIDSLLVSNVACSNTVFLLAAGSIKPCVVLFHCFNLLLL
jgi:hypothetical protein